VPNPEVERLYQAALDLPEASRAAFLTAETADLEIQQQVKTLLAHEAAAETFVEQAIQGETVSLRSHRDLPPQSVIGAYRVLSLLGRGGMGTVYLAERADGAFEQRVAIKVIRAGSHQALLLDRFQQERRILAQLSHPFIASLFDGGQTPDGSPYFVMEYVAGQGIDVFCRSSSLSAAARIDLLLKVCEAVTHAHQHLVIHRDLKPANILVTAGGQPKLLDFGIAKVLDPATADAAQTSTRLLTPEYASPEQVRGEAITTATDVYALGGVLYNLMTGRTPHEITKRSAFEIARAIAEEEVPAASSIRPDLPSDIDAILKKALRSDPSRRYRSVDEFGDDLRRYRSGRAVIAAPDSAAYRLRKFVRRNWIAVTAALAVGLAVAGGVGATLWQARRAARRFMEVRQLANTFLFDFEKSIHDLPGALPARRMVTATAREYLRSLASDGQSDPGLSRELGESHAKLGKVELDLGESDAAIHDLELAIALHRSVKDDCCGSAAQRLNYIRALVELSQARHLTRQPDAATELAAEAVRAARKWKNAAPLEKWADRALLEALIQQGLCLETAGHQAEAIKVTTEAVQDGARLVEQNRNDQELMYTEARVAYTLSSLLATQSDAAKALDYATQSRDLLDALLAKSPENRRWRSLRIMAVSAVASAFKLLAHNDKAMRPKALENARSAYELAREDARNDPRDLAMADLLVVMAQRWAGHLSEAERSEEAIPLLQEAAARIDFLIAKDPKNRRYRYLRQNNRGLLASTYADLKRWQEADDTFAQQERYLAEALADAPGDAVTLENQVELYCYRAMTQWRMGKTAQAREQVRRGLELAASLMRKDPSMENYLSALPDLRRQAKEYGLSDPTPGPRTEPRQF
jgi:tetratricopeptide (TPR) repeat protein